MPVPFSQRDFLFFALGALAAWVISRVRGMFRFQVRPETHLEPERSEPIATQKISTSVTKSFHVNGKTYASLDEVPSPFREKLRETLKDDNGDGIPDILQKR